MFGCRFLSVCKLNNSLCVSTEWEFVFVCCLFTSTYVTFSVLKLAKRWAALTVVARRLASGHHHLQLLTQWCCCCFLLRLRLGRLCIALKTWPAGASQFAALHCAGLLTLVQRAATCNKTSCLPHHQCFNFPYLVCSFSAPQFYNLTQFYGLTHKRPVLTQQRMFHLEKCSALLWILEIHAHIMWYWFWCGLTWLKMNSTGRKCLQYIERRKIKNNNKR